MRLPDREPGTVTQERTTEVGGDVSEGAIALRVRGIVIDGRFDTMVNGKRPEFHPESTLRGSVEVSQEWK